MCIKIPGMIIFFKLRIIQSMLQIQVYTSLTLGSVQLASPLTKL